MSDGFWRLPSRLMAENLRSRLGRARDVARAVRYTHPESGERLTEVPRPESLGQLAGWTQAAPYVLSRIVLCPSPLPGSLDLRPYIGFSRSRNIPRLEWIWPEDDPARRTIPADRLLFLDLETTGLSGGAGTIAFLAGLGRVEPGGANGDFKIRQYLLTDYPGEADFLEAVLGELRPGTVLVTYNGRSFDEPLLRTRCVLNRKDWPRYPHLDFLPTARRLWRKRFPDCALGTLELLLLGRHRTMDVPGAQIPDIWFEFSRYGYHPRMEAVLEHNIADVEALAAVAAECVRVNANPIDATDCDRTALGSLWLRIEPDTGRLILEQALKEGDERAGWLLLKSYRREGSLTEYRRILEALSPSWRSWEEKAKDAEHRLGNYQQALESSVYALSCATDAEHRTSLELRIRRLKRKLSLKRPPADRTIPRH